MSSTETSGAPADTTPTPMGAEAATPAIVVPETVVADTRPLTDVTFDSFDLHPLLRAGLEEAGFVRTTPIQAMTLPMTLANKDIAGQAQTGTGKTLAFLVTILNRLLANPARADRKASDPRAVVLAPTRELAIQIEKDARGIARQSGLRFALTEGWTTTLNIYSQVGLVTLVGLIAKNAHQKPARKETTSASSRSGSPSGMSRRHREHASGSGLHGSVAGDRWRFMSTLQVNAGPIQAGSRKGQPPRHGVYAHAAYNMQHAVCAYCMLHAHTPPKPQAHPHRR